MRFGVLLSGLAVAMLASFAASPVRASLNDGLLNYYNMDGNADDTGNGAVVDNGQLETVGSRPVPITFEDGGVLGQYALYETGAQYISVPDSVDNQFGGKDLSISAWFRVDEFDTSWQALIAKGEGSNYRVAREGGDPFMSYAGGAGDIRGSACPPGGTSSITGLACPPDVTMPNPANANGFHHVVATTQNGGLTTLWIDGLLVSTAPEGTEALIVDERSSDPPALFIGNNPGALGREWNGGIDEVGMWDRVITPGEIAYLYNGGAGQAVPEPASCLTLVIGLLGLLGVRRSREQRSA